jgi:ketosteroid isomerase-like protein
MNSTSVSITQSVLGHHLQAVAAHDLDGIMSDFTDDAVLLTAIGTFRGPVEIRGFFAEAVKVFTSEVLSEFKIICQEIDGEFAYIYWSAGSTIPMGSDTFCVRNGKIVMQSYANHSCD